MFINQYQTKEQIGRHLYKKLIQETSKNDNNMYDLRFTENEFETVDCEMTTTKEKGDTVKSDVEIKVREVRKDFDWSCIKTTILEDTKYQNLMNHSDAKHKLYVVFYPDYNKALIYKLDKWDNMPKPIIRKCNLSTCASKVRQVDKLVYMLPIHGLDKRLLSVIDFDCATALADYDDFIS